MKQNLQTLLHLWRFSTNVLAGTADRFTSSPHTARRWFISPQYFDFSRQGVGYFGNLGDIALIQLENPLIFSDTIKPICLPEANTDFNSYSRCYITGWGQIDPEYSKHMSSLFRTCRRLCTRTCKRACTCVWQADHWLCTDLKQLFQCTIFSTRFYERIR